MTVQMPDATDSVSRREVELYVTTFHSLLRSSSAVAVRSFEPAHLAAAPSLHAGAAEREPDLSAFLYSANRLPACIAQITQIVLGQSQKAFVVGGAGNVLGWKRVDAPGRRRRWYWNGRKKLAAYLASSSDLDDLIPTLVAYQLEWNKMHELLTNAGLELPDAGEQPEPALVEPVRTALLLSEADWARLERVWGAALWPNLRRLARAPKRMSVRLLGGSYTGFARSTNHWWRAVASQLGGEHLHDRPVYFISSNSHSFVNILSGVTARREAELCAQIERTRDPELWPELELHRSGNSRSPLQNLLYFAGRSYFQEQERERERAARSAEEQAVGIRHFEATGPIEVSTQLIELGRLDPQWFDPRLPSIDLRGSDAIIVNINYPLGLAAFHILNQISADIDNLEGVYILGKAATLNARIGDVMVCDCVFDEHSQNTYWFDNCFTAERLAPHLVFGSALDNQKAVTVKGTFLQNQGYLDFFYREDYTVVEMEAGPYLSSLLEDVSIERHPSRKAINLVSLQGDRDLGIIHYASDTPYTRAHTLGARGLSFHGMDSTYASSIAILERIFQREQARLGAT